MKTIFILIALVLLSYNNPPNPPEIEGPVYGKIGVLYTYNVTITDPDEEDGLLKLEIDFGDGVLEESCGCDRIWENGEVLQVSHKWKRPGTYNITGRVMDVHGAWSEWSEPLIVIMPKEKRAMDMPIEEKLKLTRFYPPI